MLLLRCDRKVVTLHENIKSSKRDDTVSMLKIYVAEVNVLLKVLKTTIGC